MKETPKTTQLEADYLIIGCGAVGMAFADVLLSETDANIIMVDRLHKPGGHWNHAYPFVRLHQPSAFYGVSSSQMGKDTLDQVGLNKGLQHLASGDEILAYYDDVMQHRFLASGRVTFFPLCNYLGNHQFESLVNGRSYAVKVNKKLVNATHMQTQVPSTHTPNFTLAKEVQLIPINDLPKMTSPPSGVVVIGGGKTGVDAILWLLEQGFDPEKISWVKSRDAWFTDRKHTQPTKDFLPDFLANRAAQFEALAQATSIPDLFDRLEKAGVLLRLDKKVQPRMYRGATVSQLELEQLRRIKNVVRMGRIQHIAKNELFMEEGKLDIIPDQLFVDCSANALHHTPYSQVFSEKTITLQPVRGGQIVFSAAFIAHIEATYTEENKKNELCQVIPLPSEATDWIKMLAGTMRNQQLWRKEAELTEWLHNNRLDGFSQLLSSISADDIELQALKNRTRMCIKSAVRKLQQFAADLEYATTEA